MKKLLVILILISSINVNAKEEIKPIRNKNKFIGIESIITIENNEEIVKLDSISLKGLLFYTSISKNDKYKIKYKLKNNNYKINNIKIKKYKYDPKNTIYRTINSPLKKLYNYRNINLEDKVLDKKLKEKGYSGINELDKYYMDYFKCDKLTDKYLRKIIKGKQTYIKESNNKINKLAYKYYYKNIFIIKNNNLDLDIYLNKRNYTNAYENYLYDMDISLELKKIT